MQFLLDMMVLIWAASLMRRPDFRKRLSPSVRKLLNDKTAKLVFRDTGLWKIAVRNMLGCKHPPSGAKVPRLGQSNNGYLAHCVTSEHAVAISQLPCDLPGSVWTDMDRVVH